MLGHFWDLEYLILSETASPANSWLQLSRRHGLQRHLIGDRPVVAGGAGRARSRQGVTCSAGRPVHQVQQGVLLAVDPDLGQFQHIARYGLQLDQRHDHAARSRKHWAAWRQITPMR